MRAQLRVEVTSGPVTQTKARPVEVGDVISVDTVAGDTTIEVVVDEISNA